MKELTSYQKSLLVAEPKTFWNILRKYLHSSVAMLLGLCILYDFSYGLTPVYQNWIYFLVILRILFDWTRVVIGSITVVIFHIVNKIIKIDFNEITAKLDIGEEFPDVEVQGNKANARSAMMKIVKSINKFQRSYIHNAYNIVSDIILFVALITIRYPFLAVFQSTAICLQWFFVNHLKKHQLKYVMTLEDPLEQKEDVNIDKLSDQLFNSDE